MDATVENKESNTGEEERDDTVEESEDNLKLVLEPDTDVEEEQGGSSAVPKETGEPKKR